ncbi:hypothetical protein [Nevskia sp.]|uniref:hypothetical protein n=1 Tax=Nevskia sp. TaxID=1929292 RepID=UPI0025D6A501|nr:hypothetical protein [Nevskia sp.]
MSLSNAACAHSLTLTNNRGLVLRFVRAPAAIAALIPAVQVGAGGGSNAVAQATFAWGDASPAAVFVAPANRRILRALIAITTGFDGAGAALTLGDAADPDRFIPASQVNPAAIGVYEVTPLHTYGSATTVLLTITPGSGATRGAGLIQLEYAQ